MYRVIAPVLDNPYDRRLKVHLGNRVLYPALDTADVFFLQRHVVAAHKSAHVAAILYVNLREPLHVGYAVMTRDKQTDRLAMIVRKWLSIHLVS